MANTKLKHLSTASLSQVASSRGYFLYLLDTNTDTDYKLRVTDLFTRITSVGTGLSLISKEASNISTLKTINTNSVPLSLKDGNSGISIDFVENLLDLSKCDNSKSVFLQSVNLSNDVGNSLLGITNGGTGADDQQSALNLLTNSAGGSANQILKTDGTAASFAGVNDLITAGTGLEWDTSTAPYTLKVTLDDVTFTSNITFNNTVTISNYNLGVGTGWISNDGTSEGVNMDTSGRVFLGHSLPTAQFDTANIAALTLGDNLSFTTDSARSINMMTTAAGAGVEFTINGSAPVASNQAGGAVTIKGGTGTGSGAGGALNLYAGDSTTGDGDINIYVTDAGTVSQVMKIHGSNKHFTVGSTGANNNAKFDIQNDTAGAACLELDQNDTDEPFIIYTGATGTTGAANIDTECDGDTSSSTVAGPHSATWTIKGMYRVNINGTDYWTPYYTR